MGVGNCRIVRDELMVEVGETKEGPHILDLCWGRQGSDAIEFDRVHGELIRFYDHSKIFNFRDIELTLLEL